MLGSLPTAESIRNHEARATFTLGLRNIKSQDKALCISSHTVQKDSNTLGGL